MKKTFYSNGKLLLTGEYVVLDGAYSIALPSRYGQSLSISETKNNYITWESRDSNNNKWFELKLKRNFKNEKGIIRSSNKDVAATLVQLLLEAKKQNPSFLSGNEGLFISTSLDFPKDWGLGSSSTLINNIAQWAAINPYTLLWNAFSGSGYDIACATHNTPISYALKNQQPIVTPLAFSPQFKDSLYFVYLNKKQNSREGIASYKQNKNNKEEAIKAITKISESIQETTSLQEFELLLEQHETIISELLNITKIKDQLFTDYSGSIKSLGAWGGDFILVTGNETTPEYFKEKGYNTVIPYNDMIL